MAPRTPGFQPFFMDGHHKALPGKEAFIAYPGVYHYLAGAIMEAGRTGLPLINDVPGLPIPFLESASPADNAADLVTLLAIHCTKLVLPAMTVMQPAELMEFREKNATHLRNFRRAMLRHADDLNKRIAGLNGEELQAKTEFFVESKILPELEDLRDLIRQPARTWGDRVTDGVEIAAKIEASFLAALPTTAVGAALLKYAVGFLAKEIGPEIKKRERLRYSPLNYLIQIERATKRD
jgi:hypothetical protein